MVVTQPAELELLEVLSEVLEKDKALTLSSGLASSVLYPPPDS